jgi:hypothetical protein
LPTLNYSAQKLKQKSRLIFISSTYSFHNRLQKDEPVRWSITVLPNAQRKIPQFTFLWAGGPHWKIQCWLLPQLVLQ